MACYHAIATAHMRPVGEYMMQWRTCVYCKEWLPLGPSDEAPVAVEVRAADLALSPHDWSPEEIAGGYVAANWHLGAPFCDALVTPGEEAGYLAELIIEHDEEQMAVAREQAESALREAASEFLDGMGESVP